MNYELKILGFPLNICFSFSFIIGNGRMICFYYYYCTALHLTILKPWCR